MPQADPSAAPAAGGVIAGAPRESAIRRAGRNALQLGGSLVGTWGIALIVRLTLPRALGPETFGVVSFADALTATVFVLLTFGVDTYIRKEVAVRERHADEFFGGLLLLRALLAALLLLGLAVAMALSEQPLETRHAVYLFGVGQFFFVANNTFAALLHARARVAGLSVVSVASKLLWGVAVAVALLGGAGARAVAAAFLLSEGIRACALLWRSRRDAQLRLTLRPRAALTVAAASLPFFVTVIAQTVCTRIGATLLGFHASVEEVGFYGAGWTLGGMALLLAPMINWVLMPMLSQAGAISQERMFEHARHAAELILAVATPMALVLALGADLWVSWLFGQAYAPAVPALRIMAPVFVLTYLAMVNSICLVTMGKAWLVTRVSVGTLILNPLLILILVPLTTLHLGPGGPGVGAALALLGAEAVAAGRLLHATRGRTFDLPATARVAKLAAICLIVVLVDRALSPLGAARVAADLIVYSVLVVLAGALPLQALGRMCRQVVPAVGRAR